MHRHTQLNRDDRDTEEDQAAEEVEHLLRADFCCPLAWLRSLHMKARSIPTGPAWGVKSSSSGVTRAADRCSNSVKRQVTKRFDQLAQRQCLGQFSPMRQSSSSCGSVNQNLLTFLKALQQLAVLTGLR